MLLQADGVGASVPPVTVADSPAICCQSSWATSPAAACWSVLFTNLIYGSLPAACSGDAFQSVPPMPNARQFVDAVRAIGE